ncbi:FHA domain-containing protein [Microbacterium sp. CFBP9034]|uniref:FHA domain-containing protein n=1 Tax=Microbacterium sp. CFBP9034 TaxID=3096540 RepID=UPI002A6B2837|nr:FHA domain-containing protein [Microbacterium sp. CFBP9034]MDY0907941.1 FHA domain-containing protein [Microbacterium sp. CFBP9034]
MPVHYSPGVHPVAVTPQGFVALADDTSPALSARIHALVADGRGLGGVLEALTGAYGTSLAAVPPFAVALAESGAVRLAARGGFALEVESDTAERISGEGVTTWTERVIPGVSRVTLVSGTDAAPPEFPVADGVVLASGLVWTPADAPRAATAANRRPARKAAPSAPIEPHLGSEPAREDAGTARPTPPDPIAEVDPPAPSASNAASEPAGEPEPAAEPEPDVAPPPIAEPEPAKAEPAKAEPAKTGRAAKAGAAASAPFVSPVVSPVDTTVTSSTTSPGLIDSAAVLSLADTLLPADSTLGSPAESAPDETPAEPAWEATVVRPLPEPSGAAPVVQGDHDGATISLAEARALRTGDSVPPPLAPPRPPAPGRIRVSTGQIMTLDRTVVIGRRPRSTRVSGTDLPHLVAVDSPQQDISRSHVELRVEGDSILATDLHTTNGTTLLRPGVDPVRLHPGEGTVVVPGDVIDLGDGITVAIEDLS